LLLNYYLVLNIVEKTLQQYLSEDDLHQTYEVLSLEHGSEYHGYADGQLRRALHGECVEEDRYHDSSELV
jgi:hypothetical protein